MSASNPIIQDGKAHVVCPTRVGKVIKRGPITGKEHIITIAGAWIDAEDAEILTEMEDEVFCFRTRKNVKIRTVLYL